MTRTDRDPNGTLALAGTLLIRVVVPLWVLAGAALKLSERNPALLPTPVRNVALWFADAMGVGEGVGAFMDDTLRFLIATEFLLVGIMVFVPRLARAAAVFTLSVFCLVLVGEMIPMVRKTGFVSLFTGDCGCFGAWSPPPGVTALIDLVLLAGALVLPMRRALAPSRGTSALATAGICLGLGVVAFGVAYGVPDKTIQQRSPGEGVVAGEDTSGDGSAATNAGTDAGTDSGTGPTEATRATTPELPTPRAGWPEAPPIEQTYLPRFERWVGAPLREQPLALQMNRPLPEDFDRGGWFVVLYRGDCDHCHELLEFEMAERARDRRAARARHRSRGGPAALGRRLPLPHPSRGRQLRLHHPGPPHGGRWRGAGGGARRRGDRGARRGPGPGRCGDRCRRDPGRDGAGGRRDRSRRAARGSSCRVNAPADPRASDGRGGAWPAPPAIEQTYFPRFEQWLNQRLDAQSLALQIVPAVPGLNAGRRHVVLYRADCDHCHELMEQHLMGEIEERVVAVRVPDTDPSSDLPMPLAQATLRSFPEGPNYVFTTPILLTIKDGVVVGLATDSENAAEVAARLAAGAD